MSKRHPLSRQTVNQEQFKKRERNDAILIGVIAGFVLLFLFGALSQGAHW